jgi:hypothetical protein
VGYLVSAFALGAPHLTLIQTIGEVRVYANDLWRARAYFESGEGSVSIDQWTPDAVRFTAEGAGRVVIAEAAYPGWRAKVDGAPVTLETTPDGLMAVTVPAGTHQVALEFRPTRVYAGIFAAAVGVGLLAAAELWSRRKLRHA